MKPSKNLFSVKAASQIAGISAHVLRAWERRHKVVQPKRSISGSRIYTPEDVEKLKLLADLTQSGHSIGILAASDRTALHKLREKNAKTVLTENRPDIEMEISNLLMSVSALDAKKLDSQMIRLRLNLTLSQLVFKVVSPLLNTVGILVDKQKLDIGQEHILSSVLRNHLGELMGLLQRTFEWDSDDSNDLPRLAFATPEGDLHEFGTLLGALIAGNLGMKFVYLGPNLPASDLAKCASRLKADVIILGVSSQTEGLPSFLKNLSEELSKFKTPPNSIWVGSSKVPLIQRRGQRRVEHFSSLLAFNEKLIKILRKRRKILCDQWL